MAKDFEWDYKVAGELLLNSEEIAEFCEKEAERMTRAAGVEYKADVRRGRSRVRAGAFTGAEQGGGSGSGKFARDPETQWPICPQCGAAHYNCECWKKKG